MDSKLLSKQSQHWENNFLNKPEMFGIDPSIAAIKSVKIFKSHRINKVLEIGAGQGRDTLYFAKQGFKIDSLDYSKKAINDISEKSRTNRLENLITPKVHDMRLPLPYKNECFEACYSHMLYCMAFSMNEIISLNNEVLRILKKGGINIFTVRNTLDGDYKNGIHRDEDLYENDGFIVHFFSIEKIKKLLNGFELIKIDDFNEGKFPRKLYKVVLKKL